MNDKRKKSTSSDDSKASGDFGLEFGGLFRGLGDVVTLVSKLAEAGEKHIERQGEFRVKGLGDQARGVYGFSIRSGIGDSGPRVEPFGNVHSSEDGLVVGDVLEPLVDVFDEGDELVITVELPGANSEDIRVRLEADMLKIEAHGERQYAKDVLLPTPVTNRDLKRFYNNGVLEVRLRKQA